MPIAPRTRRRKGAVTPDFETHFFSQASQAPTATHASAPVTPAPLDLPPHRPLVEPAAATPPRPGSWADDSEGAGRRARRLIDIVPAALTWLIVLSPFWAGFLLPVPFAAAIILFDVYWLYLSTVTALRAYRAHRQLVTDCARDWRKLYRADRIFQRTYLEWDAVRHVVIVPIYREDETILVRTLESLAAQQNAEQVHAVLAMEAREPGAAFSAARWPASTSPCIRPGCPARSRASRRTRRGRRAGCGANSSDRPGSICTQPRSRVAMRTRSFTPRISPA